MIRGVDFWYELHQEGKITVFFPFSSLSVLGIKIFLITVASLIWVSVFLQHVVEVLSLLSDDVETDDAGPGENLKLRLKGIEEEEILPGFILCNSDSLCHSGRTFDAQVSLPGTAPLVQEKWNVLDLTKTNLQHLNREIKLFQSINLLRVHNPGLGKNVLMFF